jgi:uncharacterized protein (UPF0548 family)
MDCGSIIMFTIRRPSDAAIGRHLDRHADAPFTYDFAGCTRDEPRPVAGYSIDRERVLLGRGREVFERACDAIRRWEMFPGSIAQLHGRHQSPQPGLVVGVLYRVWLVPLWVLFPARVAYIIDEALETDAGSVQRFGFAYGTVADHPERGEERFLAEWHAADDCVYYDLVAISQPAHWLAKLAYPYTRYEQRRFRRLSGRAMAAIPAGAKAEVK